MTIRSGLRFVAIPALGLALLVGVSTRSTPTASAECIGLQSGSEYCVGEVARNSEDVVHVYEPGTFSLIVAGGILAAATFFRRRRA